MGAFLDWFNGADYDPVLRAALPTSGSLPSILSTTATAELRAHSPTALCAFGTEQQRFYSMSAQIRQERDDYYDVLEHAQKGTLDITEPLRWFLGCMDHAFDNVESMLADVIRKARFWKDCAGMPLNDRQRLMLNKLLDGFDGKLTSTKWAKLAKCSQDTASRDINDLLIAGF